MAISPKGDVVCDIFPSYIKTAFKVKRIDTIFQIMPGDYNSSVLWRNGNNSWSFYCRKQYHSNNESFETFTRPIITVF